MANRLGAATSPYLLQHKYNPVDWWEWSPEAFEEARRRDVPVLLSVGYAACHWCHVMAHESFEDAATAALINERFVPVKVDREERPDIDAVYMEATQAMTGQGGWPMTCALTPEGRPFFAGTYFPKQPSHGMPAFTQILQAISAAWQERRDEVDRVGASVAERLGDQGALPTAGVSDVGAAAVSALGKEYDAERGGFGHAPKFPPSMLCEFLLRRAARTGDGEALRMAEVTLEAMARGGIYDQLGGGFARYSVDERWEVPHFEKMLYDNALLLRCYVHWWRLRRNPLAESVARETADFLTSAMTTAEGGFASAFDADSEGVEGAYYVWSPDQLAAVLGDDDGRFAAEAFSVTPRGNFEHGTSTLRLVGLTGVGPAGADQARDPRLVEIRRRLLAARGERVPPARDDKVVAAWNGLAIAALAEAGVVLGVPRYVDAAVRAAELLAEVHLVGDGSGGQRLARVSRDGVASAPAGVLEDYACVAEGFLTVFAAVGEAEWFDRARGLVDTVLAHFADGRGGFYDTIDDAERLVKRPQDPTDNATPSGQAMIATVLLTLAGLTGEERYRDTADTLLRAMSGLAERAPRFAGQTLAALEAHADGPQQVAVVGPSGDPKATRLLQAAFSSPAPGLVVASGDGREATVALLDQRSLVGGAPTAYPCRTFVCGLPVTEPDQLQERLTSPSG